MLDRSPAYAAAIVGDDRRMRLKIVIDISDPDLVFGDVVSSGEAVISHRDQLHDKVFRLGTPHATLEPNRWLLDGSFLVMPDDPTTIPDQVGFVGEAISGADGTFDPPPWVELQMENVSVLQMCSVFFPAGVWDGVAEDFTVEIKQAGTTYHTETVTGNRETSRFFSGFTVYNPDAIRVTVTKWTLPGRRLRLAELIPGLYDEWDDGMIAAFQVTQQGSFSNTAVPYGTCDISMDNADRRYDARTKNGIFQSIEERQRLDALLGAELPDGSVEYKRLGFFYQYSGGWRTSRNEMTMDWTLVDVIGLLVDRAFLPTAELPTTLEGWLAALVEQLGTNFSGQYRVDPAYGESPVTATPEAVTGKTCGDILRWVCMASGTWARADAESGRLTAEPLWQSGNQYTLDNLSAYPVMKANDDLAAILFKLSDGSQFIVSGNSTSSSNTITIENPFLHTQAQALAAARLILAAYGGNQIELTGRGDPSSELGDVDTVWLNESVATTARRQLQTFQFQDGVLQGCQSRLIQADGAFLFQERAVITASGSWTAPAGVSVLRVILVGHGGDGQKGGDGSWDAAGATGADGQGGKVWAGTININEQQYFDVTIGADSTFGAYSSADGQVYEFGYTDVASGDSFARTGVAAPLPGSGDGGQGGKGGARGRRHEKSYTDKNGNTRYETVIDSYPKPGSPGVAGVTGCVVVYWDKEG